MAELKASIVLRRRGPLHLAGRPPEATPCPESTRLRNSFEGRETGTTWAEQGLVPRPLGVPASRALRCLNLVVPDPQCSMPSNRTRESLRDSQEASISGRHFVLEIRDPTAPATSSTRSALGISLSPGHIARSRNSGHPTEKTKPLWMVRCRVLVALPVPRPARCAARGFGSAVHPERAWPGGRDRSPDLGEQAHTSLCDAPQFRARLQQPQELAHPRQVANVATSDASEQSRLVQERHEPVVVAVPVPSRARGRRLANTAFFSSRAACR